MRICSDCKHLNSSLKKEPCVSCFPFLHPSEDNILRYPNWEPTDAQILKLREVIEGLLRCMQMQLDRENGSIHVSQPIAKAMWDEWMQKATDILKETE